MNQGLGIILPLLFFFVIDLTLFVNSLRHRAYTDTSKTFVRLAGYVMIAQGLTMITYAGEYHMLSLSVTFQYILNLVILSCTTIASYIWFEYLMLAGKGTEKYLSGKGKTILLIPAFLLIAVGTTSKWTHWLFYIDGNGAYQRGTLYGLQFIGGIYYVVAVILTIRQIRNRKNAVKVLGRFLLYLLPTVIGGIINTKILRGGYTEIGCSYAVLLLYLEQYITEVNENRRLKSVEHLNRELQQTNDRLRDQMSIVGGLSNAYFSAYSVDLQTGKCKAVKVIDSFRKVVKNCHTTSIVTKAFLTVCVRSEDKEKMRIFTDWRTLPDRLDETNLIVQEFHGTISPWEWCRASWIVASRDENGRAGNVLFTVEDVTESVRERIRYEQEREQAQRELEVSRAEAEAANKAKTDFLFNMSHDIRTPMNAIMGYADLMEKYFGDAEKCRDYLDKIKKSSGFLLSLVNNVLEMARIESGKIVLDEVVCKYSELIDQVVSVYSDLMEQKHITFTTDISVETEYYYGDKVKLSEIILNIISNAYKYTNEGGRITMAVKELPCEQENYIRLQTVIADTGVGMSKEFLPRIFEEFAREHTATENKIEGTGLGMPIVKKLVDLMGGTIEVESRLGKGTTFIVTIPHKIAEVTEAENDRRSLIDPNEFKGKRILLVEDNELNREIASEVLSQFGFIVEYAEDGLVCIEMLSKAEPGYYDLILMDVQMPNLNGYDATKRIRRMEDKTKSQIPIIAMTANAFEEDRKDALAAGMNGHLAKPIEVEKLIETLAEILAI